MINFIFAKNWKLIKYLQQVEKKDQQVESMVQPHDFGESGKGNFVSSITNILSQ